MKTTVNLKIEVEGRLEPTILPIEIDTKIDSDYWRVGKELSDRVKAIASKDMQTGFYGLSLCTLDEGEWERYYSFKYRTCRSLEQVCDLTRKYIQKHWHEIAWAFGYVLIKEKKTVTNFKIDEGRYNTVSINEDGSVMLKLPLLLTEEESKKRLLDRLMEALRGLKTDDLR